MLPANLISSLQALARTAKPLIVAENNPAPVSKTERAAPAKLEAGQRIQATIQELVSPGLFKVQVAGQSVQMRLPGQLQVGNLLALKVESTSPKLTFSFFASSQPISTQEQISSSSRLLANLADLPMTRTLIETSTGKPVLQTSGASLDSKELAVALRDTLANSGLFYESHQAQWVRGERSTTQLLIEPQNQLTNPSADQPSDKIATQATAATTDTTLPIAKELIPLVQQQLHALETHQITWTGQIWPGQQMQWEIQGEPDHHLSAATDERQWSTEMELALPKLGDVHARLVFSQSGLKLNLQAADADAIALFHRRLPSLGKTLADAGISLTSSVIEKS
jgi:hypothetical protein